MTKRELQNKAQEMRKRPTKTEAIFAERLRKAGIAFEQQYVIGCYIADFLLPNLGQVIEIDGAIHFKPRQIAYDQRRAAWLQSLGLKVLRIPASQIATYPLKRSWRKRPKSISRRVRRAKRTADHRLAEYFALSKDRAWKEEADAAHRLLQTDLTPRLAK